MGLYNHALWQVAVKALLFDEKGKILTLTTPDGYLDFPGGRVDESEWDTPWATSLQREIKEELGGAVRFDIKETVFVSKRQYHREGQTHYIAAIYFRCDYKGGAVELSDEHAQFMWQTPEDILRGDQRPMSADEQKQFELYFKGLSNIRR